MEAPFKGTKEFNNFLNCQEQGRDDFFFFKKKNIDVEQYLFCKVIGSLQSLSVLSKT